MLLLLLLLCVAITCSLISINIPTSFAKRPIAGLLLATVLLFSHLFMRDVNIVDMWLVSTSAGLHLLVMHGYRQLNQRLATACRQRNELIESLSHEIRTPLHGKLHQIIIIVIIT
jgi:signal transduction histidine kinase